MGRCTAVLVGAGSGSRLGFDRPKAFIEVGGAPLLVHMMRSARTATTVDDIVVVVADEYRQMTADLLAGAGLPATTIVAGGETRADSVAEGVAAVRARDGLVAVHDVARALIPVGLIDRTIRALHPPWTAVAPGLPVSDTLKFVGEDEQVVRTVDRQRLWAVQTPQVFSWRTLHDVHQRIGRTGITDELMLVERDGGRVRIVPGDPRNFKITYPGDVLVAEALVRDHA